MASLAMHPACVRFTSFLPPVTPCTSLLPDLHDSGEGVHVFPSESDLTFWRALIEGPPGSPFEGGVFSLTVRNGRVTAESRPSNGQ